MHFCSPQLRSKPWLCCYCCVEVTCPNWLRELPSQLGWKTVRASPGRYCFEDSNELIHVEGLPLGQAHMRVWQAAVVT
jgi:hypothetical protein